MALHDFKERKRISKLTSNNPAMPKPAKRKKHSYNHCKRNPPSKDNRQNVCKTTSQP